MDELKQAFEIYNADMRKADKKYTQYNIPAAYATMLTNKDSITRVYYGDLFTDDGQYMAEKSPYYNAIDALLRARIKYVAGGQDMKVTKLNGYEIMSSVRYGKGAEEANQLGTAETRNQGMLVLTANRPDMKLGTNDRLVVNMGAAHKNQAYRPLLLSKSTGLATYLKDSDVPAGLVRYTDNQGNLTFTADDITGHSTVEVSGYLAVWVPVGASETKMPAPRLRQLRRVSRSLNHQQLLTHKSFTKASQTSKISLRHQVSTPTVLLLKMPNASKSGESLPLNLRHNTCLAKTALSWILSLKMAMPSRTVTILP